MNILDTIAAVTRDRVAAGKRKIGGTFPDRTDGVRPFFNTGGVTLIAECKKASPSRGVMVEEYDPVRLAAAYAAGGTTALSVLTEPEFFLGSTDDMVGVRAAVPLPVLRKDFLLDPWQIKESYSLGADCILLIAAMIPDGLIRDLAGEAMELGLQVLLETHNEAELERAAVLPATAVGINARDLATFDVDVERVHRLREMVPDSKLAVAESGLKSSGAFRRTAEAGFDAFLVGEYFATAPDAESRVRESMEAIREGRSGRA